jgi:hypothetical protein
MVPNASAATVAAATAPRRSFVFFNIVSQP